MRSELVTIDERDLSVMPAMPLSQAKQRRDQVVAFVREIMVSGTDFGTIPGTDKDTLLKPGAEKLTTFFGLSKQFTLIEKTEHWTDEEPFFYYLYRCHLYRGQMLIAEGDGSCNSFETKYRYRQGQRKCPSCGQATIIKGKAEYGGGWLCFGKKGGCGAKFPDGDATIETQQTGRIKNPDVCDQVNTIQKMAQKRALIAATLLAVNASEFFTQDLEDYIPDAIYTEVPNEAEAEQEPKPKKQAAKKPTKKAKANGKPTEFWSTLYGLKLSKNEGDRIIENNTTDDVTNWDACLDELDGVTQAPAQDALIEADAPQQDYAPDVKD